MPNDQSENILYLYHHGLNKTDTPLTTFLFLSHIPIQILHFPNEKNKSFNNNCNKLMTTATIVGKITECSLLESVLLQGVSVNKGKCNVKIFQTEEHCHCLQNHKPVSITLGCSHFFLSKIINVHSKINRNQVRY